MWTNDLSLWAVFSGRYGNSKGIHCGPMTYRCGLCSQGGMGIVKGSIVDQMTYRCGLCSQGGIGINVAQMIVELIRDKRKIVDRITHQQIDEFVALLQTSQVSLVPGSCCQSYVSCLYDGQHALLSPTVSPPSMRVNTRHTNPTKGTSSKRDAPSGIYTLHFGHIRRHRCVQA